MISKHKHFNAPLTMSFFFFYILKLLCIFKGHMLSNLFSPGRASFNALLLLDLHDLSADYKHPVQNAYQQKWECFVVWAHQSCKVRSDRLCEWFRLSTKTEPNHTEQCTHGQGRRFIRDTRGGLKRTQRRAWTLAWIWFCFYRHGAEVRKVKFVHLYLC